MGWKYTGTVESITPDLGDDNWTLDAVSAGIAKLKEVFWGGESVASTAMRTRVARSNGEVGVLTAGNVAEHQGEQEGSNRVDFVTQNGYATTQPALNAASLFALSWNSHGGLVRWVIDPEDDIWLITGQTFDLISCRNAVGVGTSSYGVIWEEIGG